MIRKVLIANRGEIAVRVMRSCREMGIRSVAVFSEADRTARHVLYADEAVLIGPAASKDSYLNIEKIIRTAKQHKVDAIHPGYGFLSENADFARACEAAGITFIGPPSDVLGKMDIAYLARGELVGPAGMNNCKKLIRKAFEHQLNGDGFCLVELLSPCPTNLNMPPVKAREHVHTEMTKYFPVGEYIDKKGGDQA